MWQTTDIIHSDMCSLLCTEGIAVTVVSVNCIDSGYSNYNTG